MTFRIRTCDRVDVTAKTFATRSQAEAFWTDVSGYRVVFEHDPEADGSTYISAAEVEVYDAARADDRTAADVERDGLRDEVARLKADVERLQRANDHIRSPEVVAPMPRITQLACQGKLTDEAPEFSYRLGRHSVRVVFPEGIEASDVNGVYKSLVLGDTWFRGRQEELLATIDTVCAERDKAEAEAERLQRANDKRGEERDDWKAALQVHAPGCISSPPAARHAIGEMVRGWNSAKAEVERLKDELRDHRTDAPDDTNWHYLVQSRHALKADVDRLEAAQKAINQGHLQTMLEVNRYCRDIEDVIASAKELAKEANDDRAAVIALGAGNLSRCHAALALFLRRLTTVLARSPS